jgi:hypothetical protein
MPGNLYPVKTKGKYIYKAHKGHEKYLAYTYYSNGLRSAKIFYSLSEAITYLDGVVITQT